MTRINLVQVEKLADQHLMAEWREIKMIPAALRRSLRTRKVSDILKDIPVRYTLNKGHVTFFFDKMKFLTERYELLTYELLNRNYNLSNISSFSEFLQDIPAKFCSRNWLPDNAEIEISKERILNRISEKPEWYRYYGTKTKVDYFKNIYNE